jgi:Ni,Fe-hydrogenase I large subunit
MEIGIKQKEIEKLLKEYEKIMESLKEFAATKYQNKKKKENITNEDVKSLLETKYSKENSPEFRKIINNLGSELRILNFKIQTKMKELQKLQKIQSSS